MKEVLHDESEMPFQHRIWKVQTIGWIGMLLFVIAAMLGLLGGGALSRASEQRDELRVDYDRFGRLGAQSRFLIHFENPAQSNRMMLTGNFLKRAEIIQITPSPIRAEALPDGVALWIAADDDAPDAIAVVEYRPFQAGTLKATVNLEAKGSAQVTQFVYP